MKKIIVCLFVLFSSVALSEEEWTLEINRNDIAVYTKYDEMGEYKSFLANTLLDAEMVDVVSVLKNIDGYTSWFAFTNKAEVLDEDADGMFIYMETSFPWPFKNEDMIYKLKFMSTGESGFKIDLIGMPEYMPPVEGINRMKKANGFIELEAHGSKTRISYFMHSEPGGDIPLWLVNSNLTELPYKTLANLKQLLEKK